MTLRRIKQGSFWPQSGSPVRLYCGSETERNVLRKFCLVTEKILTFPIKLYRKCFSGLKISPCCRFRPTCSEYALRSVGEWGVLGLLPAVFRILRCNPLFPGGDDPVPRRPRKKIPKTRGLKLSAPVKSRIFYIKVTPF